VCHRGIETLYDQKSTILALVYRMAQGPEAEL
jgi:hypothetical protein